MKGRVSIVIPTRNSAEFLENSLKTIKSQSYLDIETIIVDGKSKDATIAISKKYHCKIYQFVPKVKIGLFDAPYKRNLGMERATGEYVYWMDADMELPKNLIAEAVALCKKGFDAVVLPEDSFGVGIWSMAKWLERRCYWKDNTVECSRFYKKSVWKDIGGFDESLGAGGDDLDLAQKLVEKGYKVGRTKSIVRHNEGNLTFKKLYKKKFMYGREMLKYIIKRPRSSIVSYFPIRRAYIRNWRFLLRHPYTTMVFIFMRSVEYVAGFAGLIYSFFERRR